MAQLRDAQTSEFIGHGTPLQVALAAERVGRGEVLFDGVGEGFDPDEIIATHRDALDALQALAADTAVDKTTQKDAEKRVKALQGDLDANALPQAEALLKVARKRLK